MVNKFLNALNMEVSGLHQAAYLLGFFALSSQVLALVRDRLLAHYFGASLTLDIYYAAFRIPDFIFITVASMVSVSVLIPFIVDKMNFSKEEAGNFISSILSFFFVLIIVAGLLAFLLAPKILPIIFPGFFPDSGEELILLTKILLLSPLLLGLSNLFGSINQVFKKFFVYALSPVLYNVGIIFGILFLYPHFGIKGVVYGVVLGAMFHLFIQIPFAVKTDIFPKLKINFKFSIIKKALTLSIPRTITLGLNHIVIIFLFYLASFMSSGSISIFNFSFNLQSVPLSIIAVSYSLAAFPTLAGFFTRGEIDKFMECIITSAKHIIFWSIPVIVLFVVLRAQIVRSILGTGEFGWPDTRLTAAALAIFSISVIFQGMVLLFVRGYYAAGNTVKPLVINVFSSILTIVLAFVLVGLFEKYLVFRYLIETLFRVDDLSGTTVLMLPLAYSLGITINCLLLWIMFEIDFKNFSKSVLRTFFQSFSASIIMGLFAYIFLNIFVIFLDINTFWGIFLQGLFSGLLSVVVFIFLLKVLKNKEIDEVWGIFHKKFWKSKVIGPDANIV